MLKRIGAGIGLNRNFKGNSTPSPMSDTGKREDTGAPESGLAPVGGLADPHDGADVRLHSPNLLRNTESEQASTFDGVNDSRGHGALSFGLIRVRFDQRAQFACDLNQ